MASHVEVRQVDQLKGRGLFALTTIDKGQIILEEKPVVSSQFLWNAMYKYVACDHCMRSLESAENMCRRLSANPSLVLPHPECDSVLKQSYLECCNCKAKYCCVECQNEAWQTYHQVVCIPPTAEHPLIRLQEAWRSLHYPPETASIMLLVRMVAAVKQSQDKGFLLATFDKFCKTTVNEEEQIAHKMLGKEFQGQLELLRTLFSEAVYDESVSHWFTPEGFRSLFALLGTNGQGIGTSSLSKWVHSCDSLDLPEAERKQLDDFIDQLYIDIEKESGSFLNCEGSGLYLLQSSCNHSCQPNAEIQFNHNNNVLSLVALEDIQPEEEIHICYLAECKQNRSRHSRQKILRENYLFNCQCQRCSSEADQPDVTSSEEEDSDMEQ